MSSYIGWSPPPPLTDSIYPCSLPGPGRGTSTAYREVIRSGDVDGFVLSETNYTDARVELLSEFDFPFAAFGHANHPSPFPWVDVDGAAGIATVVEHVASMGHHRIALVAWPEGSKSVMAGSRASTGA